jgi:ribosomal protein S27AE
MPYKDPIKLKEHARLRQRKFRLKEEIKERERIKRKERYKANPTKEKEYNESYCAKHPDKRKAREDLNNAIALGKIQKQNCSNCGTSIYIHGHHEDYSVPLKVKWLCAKCHMKNDKWLAINFNFPMGRKFPELLGGKNACSQL